MMQDFTLTTYKILIQELLASGYSFQTFQDFIQQPEDKTLILRHDVDRKPGNALVIAEIEKEVGIRASYYFRIVKESYDEDVIIQIAKMGHEIGYHYENLSEISRKAEVRGQRSEIRRAKARDRDPQISQINVDYLISRGHTPVPSHGATGRARTDADIYPADPSTISRSYGAGFAGQKMSSLREKKEFRDKFFELAICDFERNLRRFRKLYPVKTICMHGSPLSKWDNRHLWEKYDYRDFGIIAEPYFDVDFDEVFYLTDTGRRWDGGAFNIRDKVKGTEIGCRMSEAILREDEKVRRLEGEKVREQDGWMNRIGSLAGTDGRKKKEVRDLRFRSTWDIIEAVERGLLPDKVMLNTHPQRWTDNPVEWTKELVWQNVKNVVKRIIVRRLR